MSESIQASRSALIAQRELETIVAADRQARVAEHKQAWESLAAMPLNARPLNIYADGDSWFDYPLPVSSPEDVITKVASGGSPQPVILKMAHYGDEAQTTLGLTQRRDQIIKTLTDKKHGEFDAILFSSGGNDIVGDLFCLWVKSAQAGKDPAEGLDMGRLRSALGVVESAYLDLIEIRDEYAPDAIIFLHSYDFAIPDGRQACAFGKCFGPWLQPSLHFRGWKNLSDGQVIVKNALLDFNALLTRVAQRSRRPVVLVPTQDTLSGKDEWSDELHPTPMGLEKSRVNF